MLAILLVFEVILTLLIILTTCMVENKFKGIKQSLNMYNNSKAYATEERIAFIEYIVKRYNECLRSNEQPDIDSIVKKHLSQEYIGKFSYLAVKNIATKLKGVMWGVVIVEILGAILNREGSTFEVIVIVSISGILTIGMEFYTIVRGINEKSEDLIAEVSDYVVNTYIGQEKKLKEIKGLKVIDNKIIALDKWGNKFEAKLTSKQEEQLRMYKKVIDKQNEEVEGEKEITISTQDIVQFLGILS